MLPRRLSRRVVINRGEDSHFRAADFPGRFRIQMETLAQRGVTSDADPHSVVVLQAGKTDKPFKAALQLAGVNAGEAALEAERSRGKLRDDAGLAGSGDGSVGLSTAERPRGGRRDLRGSLGN